MRLRSSEICRSLRVPSGYGSVTSGRTSSLHRSGNSAQAKWAITDGEQELDHFVRSHSRSSVRIGTGANKSIGSILSFMTTMLRRRSHVILQGTRIKSHFARNDCTRSRTSDPALESEYLLPGARVEAGVAQNCHASRSCEKECRI